MGDVALGRCQNRNNNAQPEVNFRDGENARGAFDPATGAKRELVMSLATSGGPAILGRALGCRIGPKGWKLVGRRNLNAFVSLFRRRRRARENVTSPRAEL